MCITNDPLVNIGYGNSVSAERISSVLKPSSAPVKKLVADARKHGRLIAATYGRVTRAVLVMNSEHILLSAIQPTTIAARR